MSAISTLRTNMKLVTKLNKKGYGVSKSSLTDTELNNIRRTLTVSPRSNPGYDMGEEVSFPCYRENSKWIYVPKWYGIKTYGSVDEKKIDLGTDTPIQVEFCGTLREVQQEAVDKFFEGGSSNVNGGLLVLPCGFGKTVCALHVIARAKTKTLVIVHKDFLLKQWKERIQQYLPSARVGIIKGKTCDVDDKDIVLGMLQSVSMKDYDSAVFDGFGLAIVDEVHHIAAEVFSRALHKINFKHTLGLSATPTRKDGLTKVIKWFLGDVVYKASKRADKLIVESRHYYDDAPEYSQVHTMFNGRPNLSRMINSLCDHIPRTQHIIDIICEIKRHEPLRNIIVLSDRRNHLDQFAIGIRKCLKHSCVGFYVGGMKERDLQNTEDTCDVILATYSMAAEAMDIPKLDTLILASPKGDVEQALGRIQRKPMSERKYVPKVIDIVDNFSIFKTQHTKRLKHYKKMGYDVHEKDDESAQDQNDHPSNLHIKSLLGICEAEPNKK